MDDSYKQKPYNFATPIHAMANFQSLEGDLYVGKSAEGDDRIDSERASELYSQVVFISDKIDLRFYCAIGGHIPLSEGSISEEYEGRFYYPHYNETTVEVAIDARQNLELYEENISVRYSIVQGDVYLRSESEITAYSGNHLVTDEKVYKVIDPLISRPTGQSEHDEFLDTESVDEPIRVKNVETEVTVPVEYDKVVNLTEVDRTGALKVKEPDDILSQSFEPLRDN